MLLRGLRVVERLSFANGFAGGELFADLVHLCGSLRSLDARSLTHEVRTAPPCFDRQDVSCSILSAQMSCLDGMVEALVRKGAFA